jgi:hypothetical protein
MAVNAKRKVGIVFPENQQVKIFKSVRGAARYLDCNHAAIIKAIKAGRRVFGYEVFYAS